MHAHHEVNFEDYVTRKLVGNGWREGKSSNYDQQHALYPEDVIEWVKEAYPDQWKKLKGKHGDKTGKVIVERIAKQLSTVNSDTISILRHGFQIPGGGTIPMSQSKPDNELNEAENKRYKKNILRVVRQLRYTPVRDYEIDLAFFINGLPVGTVELKTEFTQSIDAAIEQYCTDRLPVDPKNNRKEPLLTKGRGAVVHFAMSDEQIFMTTDLNGEDTFFLPFNKGNNGHAGNAPREDGEYPVAYFWEEVATFDNWLRIFHSFVYTEKKNSYDKYGHAKLKETLIFPRYHQLESVNKMIDDVRVNGSGKNYLVEHSAGSGKTSTIAWTAHDLTKITREKGKALFDSVIIVTDRTVLDSQLQEAIQQLDHQAGVICAIDKIKSSKSKSEQLKDALESKTPIIVVTIQTFPFAMEAIIKNQSLADGNYAVIIDEAHTSQTGSTATGLRAALSLESEEDLKGKTLEEFLLAAQKARVMPENISHFAFTATPKHSTYMLFGRPEDESQPVSDENLPKSFHLYTQRQAIEEGFILDVLQNYTTYDVAFRLGSSALETGKDKRVDQKLAKRALAKSISLHPTNVTQKVDFIISHFKQNVAHLLNGEAKAMVVTSGRPQAVKYKLAFDKYIERNGIKGLKALVAFSGKVPGKLLGDESEEFPLGIETEKEYTEYNLNPDAKGDLRNEFDTDVYQIMLVANKFQTGFNQPKLCAMYLDKKISDIEAVQTLSRLNRTYKGKDKTFVIDFANDAEVILSAFKKYDTGAEVLDVQDLDIVYDEKNLLDNAGIYNQTDIEHFMQVRGSAIGRSEQLHRKLFSALQRPTDVFNEKMKTLNAEVKLWEEIQDKAEEAEDSVAFKNAENQASEFRKQREALSRFKTNLARFVKTYSYIAQLIELGDAELENFASFAQLLSKRLNGIGIDNVDVGAVTLDNYHIKKTFETTEVNEKEKLYGRKVNESDPVDREKKFLSDIINRLNVLFGDIGDETGRENFANGTVARLAKNENVVEQVTKNDKNTALQGDLPKEAKTAIVKAMMTEGDIAKTLLKDPQILDGYCDIIYDMLMHKLKAA